jgi:hypothetical protein
VLAPTSPVEQPGLERLAWLATAFVATTMITVAVLDVLDVGSVERWAATAATFGTRPAVQFRADAGGPYGGAVVGPIRPLEADHPLQQEFQRIEGVEGDDRLHRVVVEKTRAAGPPRPDKFPNSDDRPARKGRRVPDVCPISLMGEWPVDGGR